MTSTPVVTRVPTLISAPTRTAAQEQAFVLGMLKTNDDCELPCWWGITPGEATLQTLRERFGGPYKVGFQRRDGATDFTDAFRMFNHASAMAYVFDLHFIERDDIVHEIEVESTVYLPDHFAQDWQRYSPDQVLSRYGAPSRIQLRIAPALHPGSFPSYDLQIVYEKRGFWIRYVGSATYGTPLIHVCPSLKNAIAVDMRLQSPQSVTPVFEPDPTDGMRPIEEATGMSLQAFYEKFKNPGKQVCLEAPVTPP